MEKECLPWSNWGLFIGEQRSCSKPDTEFWDTNLLTFSSKYVKVKSLWRKLYYLLNTQHIHTLFRRKCILFCSFSPSKCYWFMFIVHFVPMLKWNAWLFTELNQNEIVLSSCCTFSKPLLLPKKFYTLCRSFVKSVQMSKSSMIYMFSNNKNWRTMHSKKCFDQRNFMGFNRRKKKRIGIQRLN